MPFMYRRKVRQKRNYKNEKIEIHDYMYNMKQCVTAKLAKLSSWFLLVYKKVRIEGNKE